MPSASEAGSFRTALASLDRAQKPGHGVPAYTRWINRRLARYVAAASFQLGLSPNTVSLAGFATSIAGLITLLAVPGPRWFIGLCAASLLALGFVLDSADGQLARLQSSAGPAGEWLDHVLDAIRTPAIHLTILVSTLHAQDLPLWIAAVAAAFILLQTGQFSSQMLASQLLNRSGARKPAARNAQSWILLPVDTGVMCWIFVLWGLPTVFSLVYAAAFLAAAVQAGASTRRRYRELSAI